MQELIRVNELIELSYKELLIALQQGDENKIETSVNKVAEAESLLRSLQKE